jgi:hypothetical protein
VAANSYAPHEDWGYFPPLDDGLYCAQTICRLRASLDKYDEGRDPENLTLFQRAALADGEAFCCRAFESSQLADLAKCPIIAAVSIDCLPFNENATSGAPSLICIQLDGR